MGRQAEGPRWAWGSLGLAAAILNSCFLLTQTREIHIKMEPSHAVKGQYVTLSPEGTEKYTVCAWYRGRQAEVHRIFTYIPSTFEQQNGPVHTGREIATSDCSLHISDLAFSDTGEYIVSKIVLGDSEVGRTDLEVIEEAPDPPVSNRHSSGPHDMNEGRIAAIAVWALAGAVLLRVLL